MLFIRDNELTPQDTLYGKLEFIQVVGITQSDAEKLKENPERVEELYRYIKQDNPDFLMDVTNMKSYL